ncbi:MAG: ExeM/NucH family extracellular endonuclease, partial [Chloroflexota bacterium]
GLSISNYIRGGDTIDNLTGIMHWSYAGLSGTDAWRVRPVLEAIDYTFTPVLPRPVQPNETGGSFKVAAFNVLNYFDTIDDGIDICGPLADMECRGADSAAELERQREKIVSAMLEMDADVIGLMEIENDAGGAVQDLVNGLNAIAGPGTFDYIDTGFIGSDAIKVALIYNTATANPVGDYAILDSSVDPNFDDTKNRPALAQTFEEIATGAKLTVAVNHLKSKGSSCNDVGDPNTNDGQGNCNVTRANAATALATWLAGDPTNSGDPDAIVIGDLNSYRMEDPIDALKAAGYTDLLDALIGPDAYTYLFDGQLGYLDYAMSNSTLTGQVAGVTPWNINADEIPVLDYNDDIEDSGEAFFERESSSLPIFEPNPYRASDHDPVLTGLNLNAPPVCSTAMPVPEELWPVNHEFVPVSIMGVTDPDGDAVMVTIDSIYQDEPVLGSGSGNTAPDGDGVGTDTAWLRAEREGGGNGRAYHVFFTADDGNYNSCSGEVIVYVPKSQGKYSPRIDDGALYDSTQP